MAINYEEVGELVDAFQIPGLLIAQRGVYDHLWTWQLQEERERPLKAVGDGLVSAS